jgi:hypothetical protein
MKRYKNIIIFFFMIISIYYIIKLQTKEKIKDQQNIQKEKHKILKKKQNKISVIILNWKRLKNVKLILSNLFQHDFINEFIIWNNNPDIILTKKVFHKFNIKVP